MSKCEDDLSNLSDWEEELYLRISAHLGRMTSAAKMQGRVSVDAAVNWARRDAFIRDLKLTDLQLRQHIVFQATREGYIVEPGLDRRSKNTAAPTTKVWITAPEKWR